MDEEEYWIEDKDENDDREEEDDDVDGGCNLFSVDERNPNDEFELKLGQNSNNAITINLSGIQARYPHLLQSTGLTIWKGSERLGEYLCQYSDLVRDKIVVELGAGLGLCGIVAHKLGARRVVLTDGDTDTLRNMRTNVFCNISTSSSMEKEKMKDASVEDGTIVCKQLLWGKNVAAFCQKWAPPSDDDNHKNGGFDVVMGGDIAYAQESLEILFETSLALLSSKAGSIFLLSFVFRGGVTREHVLDCAARHKLSWTVPENGDGEGVYVFTRL